MASVTKRETTPKRPRFELRASQVIAERELWLAGAAGGSKKQKVWVRFGKPRPWPGRGGGYLCIFRISGPEQLDHTSHGAGEDSLQALYLAMHIALVELVTSAAYREGRLTWSGGFDLGLPLAEPIKKLVLPDPKVDTPRARMARTAPSTRRKRTRRAGPRA
jgi:hypothetical protein